MTLVPHVTLLPESVLVPQITLVPQVTELPQVTLEPVTRVTAPVLAFSDTDGDNDDLPDGTEVSSASALATFKYPAPTVNMS